MKIQSFTDLNAWKETHKLAIMIYKVTRKFPKEEMFGLISQIRRAAVSVVSNIAEGFSRQSGPDKRQFYATALGSLTELQSQMLLARDLNFLLQPDFKIIAEQTVVVSKLLNGLMKSSFSRNT